MLTSLSNGALIAVVIVIIVGSTAAGIVVGRLVAKRSGGFKEPLGVVQGALVGFVALLLAFGLTMAVDRYENRRDALVAEANAIGTAYLRAQTLTEPVRSQSLALLRQYTDARIDLSDSVPDSGKFNTAEQRTAELQDRLWPLASEVLNKYPTASAPRLYVDTLNETFDADTTRVAALENRIPQPVLWVQILASAFALGVLGMFLATHERGVFLALLAAVLVSVMLLVIFDLDRPHRGLVRVPDRALVELRESMNAPPAAPAPQIPAR